MLKILKILIVHFFVINLTGCTTGITSMTLQRTDSAISTETEDILINLEQVSSSINRNFYGTQLDLYSAPPPESLVRDLGVGRIRLGGNEYDVYNWKTNTALSKKGKLQLHELSSITQVLRAYNADGIFQINLLGYQPELEGNRYVLRPTFTASEAKKLIQSINSRPEYKITHWSLGNEFEQWHETHSHLNVWPIESGISADEYIQKYIEFAIAIREGQESISGNPNDIQIWGPEISASWLDWNTGNFTKDCRWHDRFKGQVVCSYGNGKFTHFIPYFLHRLKEAESNKTINPKKYRLLDYLSFHYYPNFRTKIADPASVVTDSKGEQLVDKMLESTRNLHDPNYTNTIDLSSFKNFSPNIFIRIKNWRNQYYPEAKLALNEFAIDSDYRSVHYHPIVRPLYTADAIGIAAKSGLDFFNNFVLSDPPQSPVPWALLRGGTLPTDAYYIYKLFSQHFLGEVISCKDSLQEDLNCYAIKSEDNLTVAIINKSRTNKNITLRLEKDSLVITDYNAPRWSVSMLKFKIKELPFPNQYKLYRYGAEEMELDE